jgi:nucleoside-diphosphate-sugar epimerase
MDVKTAAVLGASGFIGSHLVDKLIEEGIKPIMFDRVDNGHPKEAEFMLGDICDAEAVSYAVGHSDVSINLAGILGTAETVNNPAPSVKVNILGALNYFNAVREHNKKAVQITVGNHFMNNSYSITKSTAERLALMYNHEHGTRIGIVRALNAYGERQKWEPVRKIIPSFIHRALSGEPIQIYGDGEQIMDMIYVKDLADVLFRALTINWDFTQILEAGTGRRTTVNQIAQSVANCIDGAVIEHLPMRKGETENSVVLGDPKTLKALYGSVPEFTQIDEIMPEIVDWYR